MSLVKCPIKCPIKHEGDFRFPQVLRDFLYYFDGRCTRRQSVHHAVILLRCNDEHKLQRALNQEARSYPYHSGEPRLQLKRTSFVSWISTRPLRGLCFFIAASCRRPIFQAFDRLFVCLQAMSYDMKQVVDYLREHGADDSIKCVPSVSVGGWGARSSRTVPLTRATR